MFAHGLSPVSTTMPPIRTWASTPATSIHARPTTRRRGTSRRCDMSTAAMTLAETNPVNNRLICSIAACPVDTSTNFVELQFGQSSQPRPEPVSLTRAPVSTIAHSIASASDATREKLSAPTRLRIHPNLGLMAHGRPAAGAVATVTSMITSFDDYPIHQSELPIAHTASGDPNHYDRYFFNGYSPDGSTFFAVAMGIYPNRHVMDASFSVVHDGEQVNVHASARAHQDRAMCNTVGPVSVIVEEPMKRHRIIVEAPDHGLRAELVFHATCLPYEEPVFRQRSGNRTVMNYTRLTQAGRWDGWYEVDGQRIELRSGAVVGSRDRSWGVRPVGERVQTGAPVASVPQFYWLWAPVCFDGFSTFFDINEYADGQRWHHSGAVADSGSEPVESRTVDYSIRWQAGTRHMAAFDLRYGYPDGDVELTFEPIMHFQMYGLGYGHPEWTHGAWKGENIAGGDRFAVPVANPMEPHHIHVQTLSTVTCTRGGKTHRGTGVLETLVMGAHSPSGFSGLLDPA